MKVFEENIDSHDGNGAQDRFREHAKSAQTANRRGTPDGGSCGKTLDGVTVFEDNTGTKETYTADNLRDDTAVIAPHDGRGHEHIERGSDRYQRYRSRADNLAVQLALHADQIPQSRGQNDLRYEPEPICL